MHALRAANAHARLPIVQIIAQHVPIQVVHLRMIEVLVELHPPGFGDLARTRPDLIGRYHIVQRSQRHHHVQIGTGKVRMVGVPHTDQTLEARPNARLLEHLTHGRLNQILGRLHVAAGQFPAARDYRLSFADRQDLVACIDHEATDADHVMGERRYVGRSVGADPAHHHDEAVARMMEVEAVLGEQRHQRGAGQIDAEPDGTAVELLPPVERF